MTDVCAGGLARETVDAQTGTARIAALVREALVFVDTDSLFAGVVREALVGSGALQFAGLTREALDAQTGTMRLAGLVREALISGRTGSAFAGLAREVLVASRTTVSFAGHLREALLSTTAPPIGTPSETLFIANLGWLMGRR